MPLLFAYVKETGVAQIVEHMYHKLFLIIGKEKWLFLLIFLQLDNADEQAAQVRRELDGRLQMVEHMCRVSAM